jgi:predicted transport protein
LKKEIVALKWQKKIRQTLMKNNKPPIHMSRTPSRMQHNRTWRTQRVEEIQNNHENHRNLALKNIERQHSQRRTSLQMRVDARNKTKQMAKDVALRGNEAEVEKETEMETEVETEVEAEMEQGKSTMEQNLD